MSESCRCESPPMPAARGWIKALLMCWLLLSGCATLPSDFKQPGVTVISIKPLLLNSVTPEFDIQLKVTNPNRKALELTGLSYEVRLAGSKVVDGVASDLPRIEAYGEAEVMLRARADLLGGLGLISKLMEEPDAPVPYEFNAEIDIGMIYPTVKIRRTGQFTLN